MRPRFIAFCLCFIFSFSVVYACSPSPGDWWYDVELEVEEVQNNEGITVRIQDQQSFDSLEIENMGSTPLYTDVTQTTGLSNSRYQDRYGWAGLPFPYIADYKLVNSTVYSFTDDRWQPSSKKTVSVDGERLQLDRVKLFNSATSADEFAFVPGEKGNVRGDDRPKDLSSSPGHNFTYDIIVGDEKTSINGTVSYSVSDNYNPNQRRDSVQGCNPLEGTSAYILVLFGGLFLYLFKILPILYSKYSTSNTLFVWLGLSHLAAISYAVFILTFFPFNSSYAFFAFIVVFIDTLIYKYTLDGDVSWFTAVFFGFAGLFFAPLVLSAAALILYILWFVFSVSFRFLV